MDLNIIEIQIFVSCPRDVNIEKAIVAKVCDRVNKNLIRAGCNIRLTFRDFSEIIGHTGERPQQLINDNITGYDIYLGILHMRFGSPTGGTNPNTGKSFESGTEEEFVIATNNNLLGKAPGDIYFFFKKQVGSESTNEIEQARKVLAFKESLMGNNWVNSFETTAEFDEHIMDLLSSITMKLCVDKLKETKQAIIKDGSSEKTTASGKIDISHFVPEFPDLSQYINRSISQPQKEDTLQYLFFDKRAENPRLKDLIVQEKRIALLGNAGSGKSVELQQTAKHFLDSSTPFISIYKRFNTYTNETIEEFLPTGWELIDPNIVVLLLDGLDEIQPQHFNTAVRKLIDFGERNPGLRMVVSCRTNFYELPNETFSGTLTGFKVYMLNDISLSEIKLYTEKVSNFNWDNFINEIYNNSYLDLVQKPFFLNILVNYYIRKGNFVGGRSLIIEDSVLSMIDLDKEHFKTSIDIPKSKKEILNLLERVAFVMEVMGKNYVTDDELEKILPNKDEHNQIKHFSAFSKNPQKGYWMFEHNNIQEFLASKVLTRQSLQKLIDIISFPPSHNKIKPTWVNTLSFFITTSQPEIRKELVNWIVGKDQEVIVKFEPDRIDANLRIQIFKQIFAFYKEKEIWLSSNKFNNQELTRFATFPEIIKFLLDEIQNRANKRIVKLNAISLLDNYDLSAFDTKFTNDARDILIGLLDEDEPDNYMVHQVLYALANLKINDLQTVTHFIDKYSKRKNQYIRAGLYKLINSSDYLDQYVDILLNGLNPAEIEDAIDDRENTNLMDEGWQLKEGLSKIKSPESLKKILLNLKSREDRRRINRYDNKEVIESILNNAFESYSADPTLYDYIYDILVTAGREYDKEYALMIIPFLDKSENKWNTFKRIWHDEDLKDFDRNFLLELLLDESIMGSFIKGYVGRDFNNQDVEKMYQVLIRNLLPQDKNYNLIELFETEIKKLSGPSLQRPQFTDWTEINKKRAQDSFDLLFNREGMLTEIQSIFSEVGKEELIADDLWTLRRDNYTEMDDYFSSSALDLLRDFTSNNRSVNFTEIAEWIAKDAAFENYVINEIYQVLHGNRNEWIKVSEYQFQFIKEWCFKISQNMNIEKAIEVRGKSTSVNWKTIRLWFFINHFNIILPQPKMLEFTLFYDFESQNNKDNFSVIQYLEQFVKIEDIEKKVTENLGKGYLEYHVWVSNASYAIRNNIKNAFQYILRDIKNANIRDYHKERVLELFFKTTEDFNALHEILEAVGKDQLRWKVIDLLKGLSNSNEFLQNYLNKVIFNESELMDSRLTAGKYLMQLNDVEGFKFIANYILENKNPAFDFNYRIGGSKAMHDPAAIPILMDLLKLSKQPEFQKDHFNNLESFVLDALYNIGIQSENSYVIVKNAIDNFIVENKDQIEHLNFLYFNIRRIEEQLYLKKSQEYSVADAIAEFVGLDK